MAIDLSKERLITLIEAAKHFPRSKPGKKLHLATLYAYTTRGKRGVILESVQAGDIRCTTVEAIARFFEALSRKKGLTPPSDTSNGHGDAASANQRLLNGVFGRSRKDAGK